MKYKINGLLIEKKLDNKVEGIKNKMLWNFIELQS